jgi:UDP-N-acetylglucosamine--N-acetylmuramyl-(pentapeptide) pyrophosphoryl-undecaprenol N-acetylglucosamine transferase
MGGSLGAARLNDAVAGLAARWRDRPDLQLLVAGGKQHGEQLRARVDEATSGAALRVRVLDYIARVELAYAAADIAVCRAGAATVAELSAVGLPAILVPYPFARANHQEHNARALERAGGAHVVLDAEADPEVLGAAVESLLADALALQSMAEGARGFGKPDAADALAVWVFDIMKVGR